MTTDTIVRALRRVPLWTIADAKTPRGLRPEPGFYAWWERPGAVPGVPAPPHPALPVALLYVGIAPRDAVSNARLRSRLCGQHIGGNVGSSTFRFGLASLLWRHEDWQPRISLSGKYRLDRTDNGALSAWQRSHLFLSWLVVEKPWRFEDAVIWSMGPPMNRDHNQHHPFYVSMGRARDEFRAAAMPDAPIA
jgi:GIY-YIG catalytic domain-containing protein